MFEPKCKGRRVQDFLDISEKDENHHKTLCMAGFIPKYKPIM